MSRPHVSPKDAAVALGASESSLKRWVDEGRLAVERTAGGHRRIPVSEVVRFAREQGLRLRDPTALGLPSPSSSRLGDLDVVVRQGLSDGDGPTVRARLLAAYLGGTPIAQLADGPLRLAFEHLGMLWLAGEDGIAREHHATVLAVQAIEALRGLLPEPSDDAPVAVGGAPGGDPYTLPSALAAAALAESGMRTVDLGADAPTPALEAAIARCQPALVWRSVTGEGEAGPMVKELRRLAERIAPVPLVVGGRRLSELRAAGLGAGGRNLVAVGGMAELAAYAKGLLRRT
jgi:excisionase family DNA binding protein